jgi:hypothetical protein
LDQWIADCTDQERGWVPRRGRESWLGLMWEVEVLRRGGVFGRSHAGLTLSEGGAVATKANGAANVQLCAAASKVVMRAGRHYAQFTVVSGYSMFFFGVIRPGWDLEDSTKPVHHGDGNCFYFTYNGLSFPGAHDWEGMQYAVKEGDRVGMLLDLDQGSMTVYKNDERLGVMMTGGLSGEYSWAVALRYRDSRARVEAAAIPAPAAAATLA